MSWGRRRGECENSIHSYVSNREACSEVSPIVDQRTDIINDFLLASIIKE